MQSKFNFQILAEKGEIYKTPEGNLKQISNKAPSHDDEMQVLPNGATKKAATGGVVLNDAHSVLSDSYTQVMNGDRNNSEMEQAVRISKSEGNNYLEEFGFNPILKSSVSPSKFFLKAQEERDNQMKKLSKIVLTKDKFGFNSQKANEALRNTLPKDEELYEQVFQIQESKKQFSDVDFNKMQYGGSTYVQKPISPLEIDKNKKALIEEEFKNRQTQLKPGKTNQPNREFYEKENSIREANQRINKRQNQVNTLGAALSPVPVVGEVYNMGSTIANGVIDAFQGEYEDVAMSALGLGISKIPINRLGQKYLPNAYKYNPFSFKPSSEKFYRQIDNETLEQYKNSNLIKGKEVEKLTSGINLNRDFGDDAYFQKGKLYYKEGKNTENLIEANISDFYFTPKVNGRLRKSLESSGGVAVPKEVLDMRNPDLQLYKKDWLQGYKKQFGGTNEANNPLFKYL